MNEYEKLVQDFIESNFYVSFDETLSRNSDLFAAGVIDSLGFIRLVDYLKSEFNLSIPQDELDSDTFITLAGISSYICQAKKPLQSNC